MNKVIVNAAICTNESWYLKGQKRLLDSLKEQGEESFYFKSYSKLILNSAYEDKILSIKEAKELGYTKILYLDCSIKAIRSLDDIWKYIEKKGYYLYESGDNCAITCNDHSLKCYGYTRDEAEMIHECASNVVGINLEHPKGVSFYNAWMASLGDGSNLGEKWPKDREEREKGSRDYRFKYHRQDQSTASLAAAHAGLKLEGTNHFVSRFEANNVNEKTIFVLKGGE